jgi:hypothetical protein
MQVAPRAPAAPAIGPRKQMAMRARSGTTTYRKLPEIAACEVMALNAIRWACPSFARARQWFRRGSVLAGAVTIHNEEQKHDQLR